VKNVDWINEAAKNAKQEKKIREQSEKQLEQLLAAFPDYCMQLWIQFQKVYKKIEESFGSELCNIDARSGDKLVINIADTHLQLTATQEMLFGGYIGHVEIEYNVKNASGGPSLPFDKILLTNDGKWVTLDRTSGRARNVQLEVEHINELFKIALWKYNK
jgi:hypothetical protein